jgi:predicted DNA repair protein MutK
MLVVSSIRLESGLTVHFPLQRQQVSVFSSQRSMMNSDQKSSELARLRRQHQLVCSVIAALLICAGIYGTVARLGFILLAPLFVLALGLLVDAFLPKRKLVLLCAGRERHLWVAKTIVVKLDRDF